MDSSPSTPQPPRHEPYPPGQAYPQDPPQGHDVPPGQDVPPHQPRPNSFFAWLRGLGIVRGADRWFGGVASGVGARIGLDPILVRGLFVLLTFFGGIGLLLYGVAWALLPEPDGRIHAQEVGQGHWSAGSTGALIFIILGMITPGGGFLVWDSGFSGVVWGLGWTAAVVGFIIWLATRNRTGGPTRQRSADTSTRPPWPDYRPGAPSSASEPTGAHAMPQPFPSPASTQDPAADSIPAPPFSSPGAGPDASFRYNARHHVPQQPAPPRPDRTPAARPGPSGAAVSLSLGLALITAGILAGLNMLHLIDLGSGGVAVPLAAALVVLGLAIVVLGAVGRRSGVLGFLAALTIVATVLTGAGAVVTGRMAPVINRGAPVDGSVAPYNVAAGNATLDLTTLGPFPLTRDIVVPVNIAVSNVDLLVPDNVPITVRSEVALGNVEVHDGGSSRSRSGIWTDNDLTINDGAGGDRIILELRGALSKIVITTVPTTLVPGTTRQISPETETTP